MVRLSTLPRLSKMRMVGRRRVWVKVLVALQACFAFALLSAWSYHGHHFISNLYTSIRCPCLSCSCQKSAFVEWDDAVAPPTTRSASSLPVRVPAESVNPEETAPSPETIELQGEQSSTSSLARKTIPNTNDSVRQNDVRLVAEDSGKIFVSMKTSALMYTERLQPLLSTWLQMFNGSQIHIVTDVKDDSVTRKAESFGMTVIASNCSTGHGDVALCCKSGVEYEQYYTAVERGEDYDWFCHFDDDVYVNVPNLVKLLKKFEHNENIYLGHYDKKWKAKRVTQTYAQNFWSDSKLKRKSFRYALGPAYCISKELMTKLPQFFRDSNTFVSTCNNTGFPDDAAVGVIIDHYLGHRLIDIETMMNELGGYGWPRKLIVSAEDCRNLVTVGYPRDSYYHARNERHRHLKYTIEIPLRSPDDDPTGFLSLHCFLHPWTDWC